ncbi:MAG: ral secretion pathway protein GspL, partial [Noviherbaspirillum sp.]|nr:ral secretion pathway protein GspL [Noviherbaspirillum sp.]
PPMSPARLRTALPNMVEDQIMSDPAENVVVPGDLRDDLRTVAVVHRGWLELLSRSMVSLGARSLSAVPAQLCLPVQAGSAVAAVVEYGIDADIAIRLAEQNGAGLPIAAEQPELVAVEVIQTLCAMVSQVPIDLYVQKGRAPNYQDAIGMVPVAQGRVTVHTDSWARWIAGAEKTSLDLMTGLGASSGPRMNWRPWRWPLALAAGLLIVNAIGLNIDWMRSKREAEALRAGMTQTYKSAFPKDPVVVDPVAQLRQKIAAGQRDSGQLAPDDFIALTAAFGEAWTGAGQGPQSIAGLEYRDRGLSVKLKPGSNAPVERIKTALGSRNLTVTQAGANVLQIRSAR